jgi:hypothetical protein
MAVPTSCVIFQGRIPTCQIRTLEQNAQSLFTVSAMGATFIEETWKGLAWGFAMPKLKAINI